MTARQRTGGSYKFPAPEEDLAVPYNYMSIYKIKTVSLTNSIVLITTLSSLFIGGTIIFIPKGLDVNLSIIMTVLVMSISYLLWQKFVTGRTEWTIDHTGVSVVWTKPFMFADNKNFKLIWHDIETIRGGNYVKYDMLLIKLRSGQNITFYHDNLTTRDDFEGLILALSQEFLQKR